MFDITKLKLNRQIARNMILSGELLSFLLCGIACIFSSFHHIKIDFACLCMEPPKKPKSFKSLDFSNSKMLKYFDNFESFKKIDTPKKFPSKFGKSELLNSRF
jgi:hypothetical protein